MSKRVERPFVVMMSILSGISIAGVTWASVAEVDVSTSVPGTVVPDGQVKVLQPVHPGTVSSIKVREGDIVRHGQVLIELDTTSAEAEVRRLSGALLNERVTLARLDATLKFESGATFKPPSDASPVIANSNRRLMISQIEEYKAELSRIDEKIRERVSSITSENAIVAKYRSQIPILEERLSISKHLFDSQFGSKLTLLRDQERVEELRGNLSHATKRIVELEANLSALREDKRRAEATFRRTLLAEYTATQQTVHALIQQVAKAKETYEYHFLRAPSDGIVQELRVHTVGGVVQSADVLLVIVPSDIELRVDAFIPNTDIGFVKAGQSVDVRISTFDFRRYGSISGNVLNVSQDAVGRPQGATPLGEAEPDPSFKATISLAQNFMNIDGREVQLTPGMTAEVGILLGKRKVIDFILEPIHGFKTKAFSER